MQGEDIGEQENDRNSIQYRATDNDLDKETASEKFSNFQPKVLLHFFTYAKLSELQQTITRNDD